VTNQSLMRFALLKIGVERGELSDIERAWENHLPTIITSKDEDILAAAIRSDKLTNRTLLQICSKHGELSKAPVMASICLIGRAAQLARTNIDGWRLADYSNVDSIPMGMRPTTFFAWVRERIHNSMNVYPSISLSANTGLRSGGICVVGFHQCNNNKQVVVDGLMEAVETAEVYMMRHP
jgi:hypothetical protein